MAFQNNKFWKYVVKKRSFILGNQSKYIQQYFCIDETTKEITCASSTKPKDITERFAFEELSQVCNSAAAEEGCSAPSAHGFAISNGGNTIWNIFCDSATERDEWVAKLTLIQGKMQKIRQLSSGSSSSTLLARSTGNSKEKEALTDLSPRFVADDDKEGEPRASSQECRPSYSGLAPAVKTRRRSSITFNFDEIDGKRAAEADIGGSNPMKASAVKSQIIDSDAASAMPRPEIIKRMTMLNNASSGQISTSGSSRLKRGLVKRASEPSSLPVSEGVAIAVAAPTSIAPTTPPSQVLSVKGGPPSGQPPLRSPPPAAAKKGGPPLGPPPAKLVGNPPAGPPPMKKGGAPSGPPPAVSHGGPSATVLTNEVGITSNAQVPPPKKGGPPSSPPPAVVKLHEGSPPAPKAAEIAAASIAVGGAKSTVNQENGYSSVLNQNSPSTMRSKSAASTIPPPPPIKASIALPPPPVICVGTQGPPVISVKVVPPSLSSIRPTSSVPHRLVAVSNKASGKAPPPPPPPLDD